MQWWLGDFGESGICGEYCVIVFNSFVVVVVVTSTV